MSVPGTSQNFAPEFQARLSEFRRVARAWSSVVVVVVAVGTAMQFTVGEITDKDPLSLWALGIALLAAFGIAALRIFFAYERLFVCPACNHHPSENDLSVILNGVWRASTLNPSSCAVCGVVLRGSNAL